MASDVVVLLHFGGPETEEQVQPFLQAIFEDPLIIRAPLGKRLRGFLARRISKKRAAETNKQYQKIGYSPINAYTYAQAEHLRDMLANRERPTKVITVNRYTPPYPAEVLDDIDFANDRIFMITLYPHFCHSTSASSIRDFDLAVKDICGKDVRFGTRIYSWWYHGPYLEYSYRLLKEAIQKALDNQQDKITVVFSAHGIPSSYADKGDPYPNEIHEHYQALKKKSVAWLESIGQNDRIAGWELSFQSRVGPVEWIKPYTEDTIAEHAKRSGGHMLMVPISFVSDHIETLYEMDVTYQELALEKGFRSYSRVQAPNKDPELARCLVSVLEAHGL